MRPVQRFAVTAGLAITLLGGVGACSGTASTDSGSSGVAAAPPTSPIQWCMRSPEPYRCRARAAMEHEMCLGKSNYDACRFGLDQMHGY